jgi:hypothetical protein
MAAVKRYIVERLPDQARTALGGIVQICKASKISRVTLIVPKKGGWENSIFAEAIGIEEAKALTKGRSVAIGNVASLTLEGMATFRGVGNNGLLVGVHIPISGMNKLDNSFDAQAILYLPWNDDEANEWWATWKPETIGPSASRAPLGNLAEAVEQALRRLTQTINLGTGLDHPSDKKQAERVVAGLRADGHLLDPVEVRRWAQRHNWSSDSAADLEAIVRKQR